MRTVLIMDPDLGFLFWLGRLLRNSGYEVLPARSLLDGVSLIRELQGKLSLLIVNPSQPESFAFIEYFSRLCEPKIIAVIDEAGGSVPGGADVVRNKPFRFDEDEGLKWLALVEAVVNSGLRSAR